MVKVEIIGVSFITLTSSVFTICVPVNESILISVILYLVLMTYGCVGWTGAGL